MLGLLLIVLLAAVPLAWGRDLNSRFAQRLVNADLKNLVNLGADSEARLTVQGDFLSPFLVPRVPGSPGNLDVQRYIKKTFADLNWHIEEDAFNADTPIGTKPFNNIIVTKDYSAPRRLVLAAHFDSKYFKDFDFIGATDSAVPCAILVDVATHLDALLEARRSELSATLQIIFFDGEEAFHQWSATDSLYGSRHLAEKWEKQEIVANDGTVSNRLVGIDLFVLLDLLGTPEIKLTNLQAKTTWAWNRLVDVESRLADITLLSTKHVRKMRRTGEAGYFVPGDSYMYPGGVDDDHRPFMQRGVPIVHVIPATFPSVWHKQSDNAKAISADTVKDFAKIFRVFVAEYLGLV
ncbi:hypothetical protein HK101_001125 [Irineochytrium annulatum]|nr:hypothetical protein HK101_001125 [Irineochytrium annulatum]